MSAKEEEVVVWWGRKGGREEGREGGGRHGDRNHDGVGEERGEGG